MAYIYGQLMGRLANGLELGGGSVVHLVPAGTKDYGHAAALCGRRPGRHSGGWSVTRTDGPVCPRCAARYAVKIKADGPGVPPLQGAV